MTYEYVEQVAPPARKPVPRAALFKQLIDPAEGFESGTVIATTFPQYCFGCDKTGFTGDPFMMRTTSPASRQVNTNILKGNKVEYYCMYCLDTGRVAGIARRRWVLVED